MNPHRNNIHSTPQEVARPKKKSQVIQQRGLLDQFSLSTSSLMIGGAVVVGLVFLMTAGKGSVNTRVGRDSMASIKANLVTFPYTG